MAGSSETDSVGILAVMSAAQLVAAVGREKSRRCV